jgi:hypothetical protein
MCRKPKASRLFAQIPQFTDAEKRHAAHKTARRPVRRFLYVDRIPEQAKLPVRIKRQLDQVWIALGRDSVFQGGDAYAWYSTRHKGEGPWFLDLPGEEDFRTAEEAIARAAATAAWQPPDEDE